jgi:hypothetical protein
MTLLVSEPRRHHMTHREEAAQNFEAAGWAIREKHPPGEEGSVGEAGGYAIRTTEKILGTETVYELHDEELNMKVYARKVASPGRAAELIEEYGAPAEISDVTPGKVPMVPPETEEDR